MERSVLILGGSGQAGSDTAALLRRWYPTLPLTIAGRDLDRAQRVAGDLGTATAVTIDLSRRDLGLTETAHAAVIATLWDNRLNGLHYAQDRGLPYLSISSGLLDIGPEIVAGAHKASAAPVLVASHLMAGTVVLATLALAREFASLDTVRVGVALDDTDIGGPAGIADLQRWLSVTSAGLVRRDGIFTWLAEADAQASVHTADGTALPGQSIPVLDVPSLALATGAPNVRVDFAVGATPSRPDGEPASVDIRIELDGVDEAGDPLHRTHHLTHPSGQRPLTALGIALGAERLLGLNGTRPTPGIHTPESLIDPAYAMERMREGGAKLGWWTTT
ncbi:saccharopine dehydrogenase [Nocardia sp. NPDC058633]|uniref:saccharopine dehydrogenase n=1 Tax=Nocardia sp. NPDC058633 TaxID=3346568 RepID=UPI003648D6D9